MAVRCVWKNVMSIRGLFALEFPVEMSSMTFPLSGWLIPFEIPAMLLGRVTALVNSSAAPAAAPAPPLPPRAPMAEPAARRARLMLTQPGCGSLRSLLPRYGDKMRCYQIFFFLYLGMLVLESLKNIKERRGRWINGDFWSIGMAIWKFEGRKIRPFFHIKRQKGKSKDVWEFIMVKRCTFQDAAVEAFPCGCKSIWRL